MAIATVVLFAVARIPTEIFYKEFGVRPEEVGLDSVQVLLQGSTFALLFSFAIGLVYGVLVPFIFIFYAEFMRSGKRRRGTGADAPPPQRRPYRVALRRTARLAPLVVPVLSVLTAGLFLTLLAKSHAEDVRKGLGISAVFVPWKAEPVDVAWNGQGDRIPLPGCESLFYLGEGDGRVVLFDSHGEETYRIDSSDVQLNFPALCTPKKKKPPGAQGKSRG